MDITKKIIHVFYIIETYFMYQSLSLALYCIQEHQIIFKILFWLKIIVMRHLFHNNNIYNLCSLRFEPTNVVHL